MNKICGKKKPSSIQYLRRKLDRFSCYPRFRRDTIKPQTLNLQGP